MEIKDLMALLDYVDHSSLAYVDYKSEADHIVISKEVPGFSAPTENTAPVAVTQEAVAPVASAPTPAPEVTPEVVEAEGTAVESPMVGVVYLQPQPDAESFVKVGDRVERGQVVCIIEAMKLMNEIQAPASGIITEILVENEQVVEFNQPLMRIQE